MSSLLLQVLVLYSTTTFTSQTSKCQDVIEKCRTIIPCESIWNFTENVCSIPGNSCAVNESLPCNKGIEFLITEYPEFKDCNCTKDGCNVHQLFGKVCFSNKGQPVPSSATDVHIRFPQLVGLKETAHPGVFENDCVIAKETCQKDNTCFTLYRRFKKACRAEESACNCQTVGHQCFLTWQELKKTVLGGCKCPEPKNEKCAGIWKAIFNNTCLQHMTEYQALSLNRNTNANERPPSFDPDDRNTESSWKLSTLSKAEYNPQHSCLHVHVECLSDTVCNRQLSRYLQACQASGTLFHANQCKTALRTFYKSMPLNVAQKLTFCDCEEVDETCLHAKELLHGKLFTNLVQAPSCLSIIETCHGDRLCREKYKAFTSKCLNHISQSCLGNNACIEYLDEKDFNCSDSAGCRKAYIDMWGTLHPVDCICDNTSPAEKSSCKLFRHTLQSHFCFSQIAGRNFDHYQLLTELPETKLPTTHKKSLFFGDAIYVAMYSSCIILTVGLVLLALLKTRAFSKQAKTASPSHLAERLMVPQQL